MRSLLPGRAGDLGVADLAELYRFPEGRRWVRGVFVSSVDGAAQGEDAASGSLSGPGDRRVFELQRSLCDVILVGAGTTRVEGYRPVQPAELDAAVRAQFGLSAVPPIAVVSRSLDIPPALMRDAPTNTILVTTDESLRPGDTGPPGGSPIRVGRHDVDLAAALDALSQMGHRRVLCEGGPSLLAQLAAAGLLDELCLTVSPLLAAGVRRRILAGPALTPPLDLVLAHLLEEDGFLFARYLVTNR